MEFVRGTMGIVDKAWAILIGPRTALVNALRLMVPRISLVVYFGVMGSGVAFSQANDFETIVNWLTRLDKDITAINRHLATEAPGGLDTTGGWSPANHETRLSELEEQLRVLTGQIEEARYELAQTAKILDSLADDLDTRMGAIEGRVLPIRESEITDVREDPSAAELRAGLGRQDETVAEPVKSVMVEKYPNLEVYESMEVLGEITSQEESEITVVQPDKVNPNGPEIVASMSAMTAEESYAAAYGLLLKKRDYVSAEQALRAFIQDYPDHKLAGNAYYWLGETFYVRNNYEGAAKAFAKGYKNFPEGAKAPDNLLKLGLSFRGMGQDESACHVFRKLAENYPNAPAVIVTRVEQEQAEAACS